MIPLPNAPTYTSPTDILAIDVDFATPPVFYQPVTVDAVLAYAVVQESTQGIGLQDSAEPYEIPLPLEQLWTCPKTGLPLWAATAFFPTETNLQQQAFWHKRGYKPHLLRKRKGGQFPNAEFRKGVHKEYQIPLPLQTALKWRAYATGNKTDIGNLLATVNALGKKRTQGYGRVQTWSLTPIQSMRYWDDDNRLIKAFPVAYTPKLDIPHSTVFSMYETAWTPPYWLASLFQMCIV